MDPLQRKRKIFQLKLRQRSQELATGGCNVRDSSMFRHTYPSSYYPQNASTVYYEPPQCSYYPHGCYHNSSSGEVEKQTAVSPSCAQPKYYYSHAPQVPYCVYPAVHPEQGPNSNSMLCAHLGPQIDQTTEAQA